MAAKKKSSKSSAARKSTTSKSTLRKSATRKSANSAKGSRRKKPATQKSAKRASASSSASNRSRAAVAPSRKAKKGAVDRVDEVQRVIDVMVERGAVEVELEEPGFKMRVRLKDDTAQAVVSMPQGGFQQSSFQAASFQSSGASMSGPQATTGEQGSLSDASAASGSVFTSPMVGTFYRSPSPDASVFVEVGDRVGPDSTICILEAMKVMNEIAAEQSGTILEILVQNGDPVEYGQPLFVIGAD